MPDLMDELRAIAPSHEIPEWATKVAAGYEQGVDQTVRAVDSLLRVHTVSRSPSRRGLLVGLAAAVVLLALVAVTMWWRPWDNGVATPASTPSMTAASPDQRAAPTTARRQASGWVVQSSRMADALLCEGWNQKVTMGNGGCLNIKATLVGIDWSAIPWAQTGTDGTRAAEATVQGTLQGENFVVDKVLNQLLPTPTPGKVPSLCNATPVGGTKATDAEQLIRDLAMGYQTAWWSSTGSSSAGVLNIAVTAPYVESVRQLAASSSYHGAYCVGTLPGPAQNELNASSQSEQIVYLRGEGYAGLAAPRLDPMPRLNLRVTIRVPEQDAQVAAVYGKDWATYVFIDPIFTLVL